MSLPGERPVSETLEQTKKLYDQYTFGDFKYGRKRIKYYTLLKRVLDELPQGGTIYDIGCGSGFWLDIYREMSSADRDHIVGVDLSPTNIAAIRERGYQGYEQNVLELDLPDSVSDATISIGVIHHTEDPSRAFGQLVRITKPSAYLYLAVYNKWHPYYYLVHRAAWPLRQLYWRFRQEWVPDAVLAAGSIVYQPLARVIIGEWLDKRTAKTMFMDQVMTPRAALFSKKDLEKYASAHGCELIACSRMLHSLMWEAVFRRNSK